MPAKLIEAHSLEGETLMPRTKSTRRSVGPWLRAFPWSMAILVVLVVVLCFSSSRSTALYDTAQLAAQVFALSAGIIPCCCVSRRSPRKIST
ncbi:hypothetical protein [Streptomyces sp. NPDC004267]|uniref:hypothetical protein n=1 Tax=Streptomyces sp. NPDC004267 TaxID=3364694 RepID=UPI0036B25842